MHIRKTTVPMPAPMSPARPGRRASPPGTYPVRRLARIFGFVGVATAVYAAALVAIAVESSIIEF